MLNIEQNKIYNQNNDKNLSEMPYLTEKLKTLYEKNLKIKRKKKGEVKVINSLLQENQHMELDQIQREIEHNQSQKLKGIMRKGTNFSVFKMVESKE